MGVTRTIRRAVNPISTAVSAAVHGATRWPFATAGSVARTLSRVQVPDVVGLDVVGARYRLRSAGLLVRPPGDAPASALVTRQYPEPGVRVTRGSRVQLWCDGGPGGVREPRRPLPRAGEGAAAVEPAP